MSNTSIAVELVVFDLDDTLTPEWQHVLSGFGAVAEAFAEQLQAPFDLADRMVQLYHAGNWGRVFNALLADLGRTDDIVLVPKMVEIYRTHKPSIALFPDADAALTQLRPRYTLGILSDGPLEKQQAKVDALGLADRVDHIAITGQWGEEYWKPHERGYRWLEDACSVSGSQCVYIGDNVAKDFVAPNRLGWRTIMVDRPENLKKDAAPAPGGEPQHVIKTMDELESAL